MRRLEPRPLRNTTMSIASTMRLRGTVTTASCTSCSSRERPAAAELACTVVIPPGWPVFQALSMSRASGPRTSPTTIRSGRSRSVERTRSASVATPGLVRSATQSAAAHLSSRVSSRMTTRSSRPATSASRALTSVVLPDDVPPTTRMVLRSATARARTLAWAPDMMRAET
jgi:hypothetical protein